MKLFGIVLSLALAVTAHRRGRHGRGSSSSSDDEGHGACWKRVSGDWKAVSWMGPGMTQPGAEALKDGFEISKDEGIVTIAWKNADTVIEVAPGAEYDGFKYVHNGVHIEQTYDAENDKLWLKLGCEFSEEKQARIVFTSECNGGGWKRYRKGCAIGVVLVVLMLCCCGYCIGRCHAKARICKEPSLEYTMTQRHYELQEGEESVSTSQVGEKETAGKSTSTAGEITAISVAYQETTVDGETSATVTKTTKVVDSAVV